VVYFRVDSNDVIAGGHVMRCIALASYLKKNGAKVQFLVADDNPVSVLKQYQMDYRVLNTDWKNLESDKNFVLNLLKSEKKSILIIDTYRVTKEYVEALAPFCKIVYLGSKPEYLGPLNLLINYSANIDYDFYRDSYDKKTQLLLGPGYAPLREEFQNRNHLYLANIKKVLLTSGNTDPDDFLETVLDTITAASISDQIIFEVVIGQMFKNKHKLHSKYDNNSHIVLLENVSSMSSLMEKCDLAISANGTTVYELSAMGIPTISFAMVDEQIKSAEALSKMDVVDYCGCSFIDKRKCARQILDRLIYYFNNNDQLIGLANRAHNLIDGNGCKKISNIIMNLEE